MSEATFDGRRHNRSGNTEFSEILDTVFNRRKFLRGSAALAFGNGFFITGCGGSAGVGADQPTPVVDSELQIRPTDTADTAQVMELGFDSIPGSLENRVSLPAGYSGSVLGAWGEPLSSDGELWRSDGSNSARDQSLSVGMQHDGMKYFPLDGSSDDGLLCVNHEYVDVYRLHSERVSINENLGARDDIEQARKEINAVGVSVFRVSKANGIWSLKIDDSYNRRFTAASLFRLSGPVAMSRFVQTPFSPQGDSVRGTLGNCGNGYTPWGTYLTCEEHWPAFFVSADPSDDQVRLGLVDTKSKHRWEDFSDHPDQLDGEFERFNLSPHTDSQLTDYRNEANGYGYVVEIDPHAPDAAGVKRTALGRFRHEGCAYAVPVEGEPLVFYSGHDGVFEYVYKFVSDATWSAADANPGDVDRLLLGDKYMDNGTLYVARFNNDGSGQWLPLTLDSPTADGSLLGDHFSSEAELIIHTVVAADLVGATPMDRPEWTAVDPVTGSVYLTLTGNTLRGEELATDAANPRADNEYGHIVRWDEDAEGNTFEWDIFVYGASAASEDGVNRSGLTLQNQFAGPDGLVIDDRGVLWVQTDSSRNDVASQTNDQILAVIPSATVGDQGQQSAVTAQNQSQMKRFMVGPAGCEITGVTFTPDHSTMFVNVQHPGNWPYDTDATIATPEGEKLRARSATVVIQRADGGEIGL